MIMQHPYLIWRRKIVLFVEDAQTVETFKKEQSSSDVEMNDLGYMS